jgi:hypothetical protein
MQNRVARALACVIGLIVGWECYDGILVQIRVSTCQDTVGRSHHLLGNTVPTDCTTRNQPVDTISMIARTAYRRISCGGRPVCRYSMMKSVGSTWPATIPCSISSLRFSSCSSVNARTRATKCVSVVPCHAIPCHAMRQSHHATVLQMCKTQCTYELEELGALADTMTGPS